MECQACRKDGRRREGGPLGLCWTHQPKSHPLDNRGRKTGSPIDDLKDLHAFKVARWEERLLDARIELDDAVARIFSDLRKSFTVLWGDSRPPIPLDESDDQKKAA